MKPSLTDMCIISLLKNPVTIDTSLEHKIELRQDYGRMLALCSLGIPRLARNSRVSCLPNDVLRSVRQMLSNRWTEGYNRGGGGVVAGPS